MLLYFTDRLAWLVPLPGHKRVVVALWGTALRTRETWARVRGCGCWGGGQCPAAG